ncbi:pimeloyl-ACP methyl ester carboxylesterase [Paucibacter oligotrophus]|uniref:Pimeloyl-ACP methyl ester carboxylesterase n=1 Tax=Roseateles oligotrophus TaxID=1769250 RepID=A0A840L9F1_9BURK|nr:alpha/beta hydrolase [Roseateles oligotrophus]MBB4842818.1 pimeloyl-ACP methyl ester carboxylesterase [Roseateles oligotrophus]
MKRLTSRGLRATALSSLLALGLSACTHIDVQDGDMFRRGQAAPQDDWFGQAQAQAQGSAAQLERFSIKAADGTLLNGVFVRKPGAQATLVYFQGAGNTIPKTIKGLLHTSAALPAHLLLWDYRGTGLSEGQGGTPQLRGDASAIVAEARRLGGEALPLVYWGYSLGSLVSGHLSQELPPQALILEGSLTNAQDWADQRVPWYATPFVTVTLADSVRAFDNRKALQDLQRPTLLLAGEKDETTPPRFSQDILQHMQHRQCATLVRVPGVGHGGIASTPLAQAAMIEAIKNASLRKAC